MMPILTSELNDRLAGEARDFLEDLTRDMSFAYFVGKVTYEVWRNSVKALSAQHLDGCNHKQQADLLNRSPEDLAALKRSKGFRLVRDRFLERLTEQSKVRGWAERTADPLNQDQVARKMHRTAKGQDTMAAAKLQAEDLQRAIPAQKPEARTELTVMLPVEALRYMVETLAFEREGRETMKVINQGDGDG